LTCHRQCDIAVQECDDKIRGQHALTSQSDKVTMPHTETCTTPMSDSHLEPYGEGPLSTAKKYPLYLRKECDIAPSSHYRGTVHERLLLRLTNSGFNFHRRGILWHE